MKKVVNFNRSIYELTKEDSELISVLQKLGFREFTEELTIPKSAKEKNIPMMDIVAALIQNGYELAGSMPMDLIPGNEKMVEQKQSLQDIIAYKKQKAAELVAISGHPLHTLTVENKVLSKLLEKANALLEKKENVLALLTQIREVAIHYAKKGDLLYPHMKVKYAIAGPSDLMWTEDDEIRDEIGYLVKNATQDEAWFDRVVAVLKKVDKMIYKEENILFPMCAINFAEKEWIGIYHDAKDYADCFGVKAEVWNLAEEQREEATIAYAGEIVMPGGHMTIEQLTALLNTLPIEITFVDADNINRFFNEGPKVFKRPGMAIDREVFTCHPPKIEGMVRSIIDDFRNNRRDQVPVWMDKNGKTFLVTYMAVRDKEKNYLGTVEVVQDMEFAKEHFTK